MVKKQILIFLDKDKTLVYDTGYPGSRRNWKQMFKILPNVIKGLKKLSKLKNSKSYIITNQAGIAIKEFPLLTEKKSRQICEYTIKELNKKGANISGYEISPYVDKRFTKNHPQFKIIKKYFVKKATHRKPNPGMINSILKREKLTKNKTNIYVIGDRFTDVKMALKVKGFGILIEDKKHPEIPQQVKNLKSKNTYIAKNFLDAAEFIIKKENKNK